MGTKNNPGKFDCYEKAAPDEPMFVLLGRDKHAACLVFLWGLLRELDGEDSGKVEEARECCLAIMEYGSKIGQPSVGFGQAALAGVMGLIQAVNSAARRLGDKLPNEMTPHEVLRQILAETYFDA